MCLFNIFRTSENQVKIKMSSITKAEIYDIFKKSKPVHNKPPHLEIALKMVSEKLSISTEDPTLKVDVEKLLLGYAKYMKRQKLSSSNNRNSEILSEAVLLKEHYVPLSGNSEAPPPPLKKRKSFSSLCGEMMRTRTDGILKML